MRIISKQLVASALDNPDLRKAVRIMDNIREALELMDELPPPVLEVLRDTFKRLGADRMGPYPDLKDAWLHYVQRAVDDARERERQEVFGAYQNNGGPKGPRRRQAAISDRAAFSPDKGEGSPKPPLVPSDR
jgi:hypothetical protein